MIYLLMAIWSRRCIVPYYFIFVILFHFSRIIIALTAAVSNHTTSL
jgi:hypothetical protein